MSDSDAPWDRPAPFRLEELAAEERDPYDAFSPLVDDLAGESTDRLSRLDAAPAAPPRDPVSWPPIPTDLFREQPPQFELVSATAAAAPAATSGRPAVPPPAQPEEPAPWDVPAPWDQPSPVDRPALWDDAAALGTATPWETQRRQFAPPPTAAADSEPEAPAPAATGRDVAGSQATVEDAAVPQPAAEHARAAFDEAAEEGAEAEVSALQTTLVTVLVALGVVALAVAFLTLFPALFR